MNEQQSIPSNVTHLTYPVCLEAAEGGFVATVVGVSVWRAIGTSQQEALARLKQRIGRDLSETGVVGEVLTQVQIGWPQGSEHPWRQFAGMFKDDPLFEEYRAEIEAYRQADREAYFRELDAQSDVQSTDELQSGPATRRTA